MLSPAEGVVTKRGTPRTPLSKSPPLNLDVQGSRALPFLNFKPPWEHFLALCHLPDRKHEFWVASETENVTREGPAPISEFQGGSVASELALPQLCPFHLPFSSGFLSVFKVFLLSNPPFCTSVHPQGRRSSEMRGKMGKMGEWHSQPPVKTEPSQALPILLKHLASLSIRVRKNIRFL